MEEILQFNLLRYILLLSFIIAGVYLNKRPNSNKYWHFLIPSIVIYSLMEGLRWMRGADYGYNYAISILKETSGDIFYDSIAKIFYEVGLPFYFFFIFVSFVLIFSIFYFVKNYRYAFIPAVILMYSFTMGQSENLMRQYFAISLFLISLKFFIESKYLFSAIIFILAYLSHSSVLFVIPFVLFYKFIEVKSKHILFILPNLNYIFLILFLISLFFSTIISDFIIGKIVSADIDIGIADKYLNTNYLNSATELSGSVDSISVIGFKSSFLNIFRYFIRNLIVILLGYKLVIPENNTANMHSLKKQISVNKLFLPYCLACSGIIFVSLVPDFEMEVISRLALYLQIFIFFMEGLIIYQYIVVNKNRRFLYHAIILLVIIECVWIFKVNMGDNWGLHFIWDIQI